MKSKLLLILLIFLQSFVVTFSIEFELEEITLPYDTLEIEGVSATGSTITCLANNRIYWSEDNGVNWKIVFSKSNKIYDFFALNPKVLFLSGNNGIIFRSTNYGETWDDISVDSNVNITHITAKNIDDYLAVSTSKSIFHTTNSGADWVTYFNNRSYQNYDLIFKEDKYIFGAASVVIEIIPKHANLFYRVGTYLNEFNGNAWKFKVYENEYIKTPTYLPFHKFMKLKDELFIASNNRLSREYFEGTTAYFKASDTIVNAFLIGDNLLVVGNTGKYYEMSFNDFIEWKSYYTEIDYLEKSIGIEKIISIFEIDNGFIIGSDKSRIYKAKINNIASSINNDRSNISNLDIKYDENRIRIVSKEIIINVEVFDLMGGNVIAKSDINAFEYTLDTSGLVKGLYILRVNNISYKFLKR
ncbi:MAG: T9SS type A sorting domain-containing protein [Candidatus Kapaibacterium sp.]